MARFFGRAAVLAGLWLVAVAGTAHAASYTEIGGCGDVPNPQSTVGIGDLDEIHGTMGDPDFRDAFLFGYDAPRARCTSTRHSTIRCSGLSGSGCSTRSAPR